MRFLLTIICFYFLQISDDPPLWFLNPQKFFPDDLYIVGLGEATTIEEAKKNAVGDLVSKLSSKVSVKKEFNETTKELLTNTENTFESNSSLLKNIIIESTIDLKRLEYYRTFKSSSTYYVLAGIDRLEYSSMLEKEIINISNSIVNSLSSHSQSKLKIDKYAFLLRALELSDSNKVLINKYNIISPFEFDDSKINYSVEIISQEIRDLEETINYSIIECAECKGYLYAVENSFKKFKRTEVSEADLIIEIDTELEIVHLQRLEKFISWKLFIKVKSTNNKTIFLFTRKGRSGGLTKELAKEKAIQTINKNIKLYFSTELFHNIINQ